MNKKYLILGVIVVGILGLFILQPKKQEVVIKTREEILKIEKENKLQEELKEAKKELEEIIKRNKILIKEREANEVEEQKVLEEVKIEILTEIEEVKRSEKLDGLLEEIDQYKYSRKFSIPTLVELKGKLSENEIKKINERLYKLYRSIDGFDEAEKIKRELNGGDDNGKESNEGL